MTGILESLSYIPGFADSYGPEVGRIEHAAEQAAAYIERQRADLVRRDGTLIYSPQEHAEREAAILVQAGEQFDAATARYVAQSEREVSDLEKQLTILDGADGFADLSDSEKQASAQRREFLREDVERLPADDLARRVRAAIASKDRAACYILNRYLPDRLEDGRSSRELGAAVRELRTHLGDDERHQKRRDLQARLQTAKALPIAVSSARRAVDGRDARMVAGLRRSFSI